MPWIQGLEVSVSGTNFRHHMTLLPLSCLSSSPHTVHSPVPAPIQPWIETSGADQMMNNASGFSPRSIWPKEAAGNRKPPTYANPICLVFGPFLTL